MAENAIKCQKSKHGTDRQTDRQTDRRTDIVPYRVALHATKKSVSLARSLAQSWEGGVDILTNSSHSAQCLSHLHRDCRHLWPRVGSTRLRGFVDCTRRLPTRRNCNAPAARWPAQKNKQNKPTKRRINGRSGASKTH